MRIDLEVLNSFDLIIPTSARDQRQIQIAWHTVEVTDGGPDRDRGTDREANSGRCKAKYLLQ